MELLKFYEIKPILYGSIVHNGKVKFGQFRPVWNKYSNNLEYQYFTTSGRKGAGGFTLKKALHLFNAGRLTDKPIF